MYGGDISTAFEHVIAKVNFVCVQHYYNGGASFRFKDVNNVINVKGRHRHAILIECNFIVILMLINKL